MRIRRSILLAFVLSALAASPAWAHGPEGMLALTARPGFEGGTVDVRASLTYANDGEPVLEGATVDVVAVDSAGIARPAVNMTSGGGGIYSALLRLAEGTWTLRVTASSPAAEAEITTTSTPVPPTTSDPRTPATQPSGDDPDDSGDHTGHFVLFGAMGAAVTFGAATVLAVTQRARRARQARWSRAAASSVPPSGASSDLHGHDEPV